MKHLLAVLVLAAAAACRSDSATRPEPAYPLAAGVYLISGSYTSPGTNPAPFTGTVIFVQPSREQPLLEVSGSITESGGRTIDPIRNASLTPDGQIGFNVGGTATTWRFDGVLSGDTITGTHVQSSWFTISGPFTARRQR